MVLEPTTARLLLVEDDERIGATLTRALGSSGLEVHWHRCGADGIAAAESLRPDLVLLDLGLPDMDGLDVCRRLRELDDSTAVVVLTARDDELDIVVGLDAGAVDYITKPFRLAELLARIRAQLRRTANAPRHGSDPGPVVVDQAARRAWLAGAELDLRAKEFDLLARLVADAGNVVPRETLMADVWDEHWFGSTKTLDFHIASLRRKIDAPDQPSLICTLRGVGFRYEPVP